MNESGPLSTGPCTRRPVGRPPVAEAAGAAGAADGAGTAETADTSVLPGPVAATAVFPSAAPATPPSAVTAEIAAGDPTETAALPVAALPAAVPLVLMIGGAYLCYEGVEKILHRLLHHHDKAAPSQVDSTLTPGQQEQEKIRSAIRTDFILSIEIIVIALASFVGKPLITQILGLSIVALVLTAAVYGVVALIVKIDDLGLYWANTAGRTLQTAGRALLWFAPRLLKALSVAGTAAMFIVGGHLWVENIHALHHLARHWTQGTSGFTAWCTDAAFSVAVGSVVGLAAYLAVAGGQKLRRR